MPQPETAELAANVPTGTDRLQCSRAMLARPQLPPPCIKPELALQIDAVLLDTINSFLSNRGLPDRTKTQH